jgi:ribosome-associated protein
LLLATKKTVKGDGGPRTRKSPTKPAGAKGGGKQRGALSRGSPAGRDKQSGQEQARDLALAIAEVALEHKALNVEIIDVGGKVDYADYVVVLSGRSDRQVVAMAGHIEEQLTKARGVRCIGLEGLPHGSWVLMDYGDVVVHIFHEDVRGYYDLESLWIDAARVSVE